MPGSAPGFAISVYFMSFTFHIRVRLSAWSLHAMCLVCILNADGS